MSRTLVGRLQLIVQAMGLGEAKKVEGSIKSIEAAARRLSNASWGQGFQRQIDKLALSAKEMDAVRRSWTALERDIASRGLTAALKKSEISAWKTATIGHLASVRAGMRDTEREAKRIGLAMQRALRPAYVMLGGYTGVYMTGVLGREAIGASAERQREYFRQRMADIPAGEQEQIFQRSTALSSKYPSVNITDIMEMARTARNTMGSTERGIEVLDRMVQGFVTLQSVKGVEAAASELTGLLRGLDNLGKNGSGELGIQNVNNLIDAFIRASQIEGNDFDVGSIWSFARRSRIGGPGLSTDFLATVAPAMIQDMGADGAGTAVNMAFKAFVTGANDAASKKNIEEQHRIGVRRGPGKGELVDGELFGTNPYEWTKKYLIPALKADGVDMSSDVAISKAVAQLSRNSSATGFLTRMITQMEQFERLISLYNRSMGTDAADQASAEDPFVAWRGFQESLRNLSAAVGETLMPVIVPGLNSLANTINSFAAAIQSGDPMVMGGLGIAGAGIAGFGAWKVGAGVYGLITAGASLQTAATMLQAAAAAQGAPGGLGKAGGAAAGAAGGGAMGWLLRAATSSTSLLSLAGLITGKALIDTPPRDPSYIEPGRAAEADNYHRLYHGVEFEGGLHRIGRGAAPPIDTDAIEAAVGSMRELNLTTVSPPVDLSQLQAMKTLVDGILNGLAKIGSAAGAASSNVDAQMRRVHSDYGVAP